MAFPTLRVRALIASQGHVLLARLKNRRVAFLPGGRVEAGEVLTAALTREIQEECGAVAERVEYLGAVENLWREDGHHIHDLSHFFLVESSSLCPQHTPQCDDDGVELYWVSKTQVPSEPVKPESVKALICSWLRGSRET